MNISVDRNIEISCHGAPCMFGKERPSIGRLYRMDSLISSYCYDIPNEKFIEGRIERGSMSSSGRN
jgi:hypothetical protein